MAGDRLTPKQEAFCLAYMETGNAAEAYRRAYDVAEKARDSWVYVEACQLLDNPKIAGRVTKLQDQAAELAHYTVRAAFEEYEAARALAMVGKNAAAAIAAVTGKVRLFGLEQPKRTKHEVTGDIQHVISHKPMTADEWAAEYADDEG